ncbi:hypothetical protein D0Z07_4022 [Hyphodiscus hymeniophilus]|uniref:Uncharacterized protein n=1 Tax=Hyphodiscus hymeniophilus TaxID=353542 RepID=A0A9P7AY46_9HELO|nr:hypothetical protein D0Z07_4022 [Hyphodiscus hymeniophilus]
MPSAVISATERFEGEREEGKGEGGVIFRVALEDPAEQMDGIMDVDQEPHFSPVTPSRVPTSTSNITTSSTSFPFLSLPLELRLKIYALLLPARHHIIVTQLPHNGYFYNTATIPAYSAQSFYPLGTKAPSQGTRLGPNLTTYRVLSSNSHRSYPSTSIYPAIIGVSKQTKQEAEGVLYGNVDTIWDFGIHLNACRAFWGDRGREARGLCRAVRVDWEIPVLENDTLIGEKWAVFCEWLKEEMTGLRSLDLTIWSDSGSVVGFPTATPAIHLASTADEADWQTLEALPEKKREEEAKWREWAWIHELLQMDALRTAKITYWGFESPGDGGRGEGHFDSWLAGRMVGDRFVRDRMIRDGVVVEGVVVLHGKGS